MTVLARTIARCLGGDVTGPNQISVPGPGHSRRDRSLSIRIDPRAPGGFLVHSFSGDDPIEAKEYVRARLRKAGWHLFEDRGEQDYESPPWQPLAEEDQESQGAVAHDDAYAAQQLSKARSMWRASVPIAGTPAEHYLRKARGYSGRLPCTLRICIRQSWTIIRL